MTSEVEYIINNKKFKKTKEDLAPYWEFIIPIILVVLGVSLIVETSLTTHYAFGLLLIISAYPLTSFLFRRSKQLNLFEEIKNKLTQKENYDLSLNCLRTMNIHGRLDSDIHNMTINARHTGVIPPFDELLTIVCLDNKILINSRPTPLTLLFWVRRNGVTEFIKRIN